jgi:hypothetical protein
MGYLCQFMEPVTFAELMGEPPEHGCGFHADLIRSVRRALRKLLDDGWVMAIGAGGPRDPHRYCVHPHLVAMGGEKAQLEALWTAIKSAQEQSRGARKPDAWLTGLAKAAETDA